MNASEEFEENLLDAVDAHIAKRDMVLREFLRLVFWKDYRAGYVNMKDMDEIFALCDTYRIVGPEGETWTEWNRVDGLALANRIREKVRFPTLREEHGQLKEQNGKE